MTLETLIIELQKIPKKYHKYDIVFAELSHLEGEYVVRLDKPIVGFWCDTDTSEVCLADANTMDIYEQGMNEWQDRVEA